MEDLSLWQLSRADTLLRVYAAAAKCGDGPGRVVAAHSVEAAFLSKAFDSLADLRSALDWTFDVAHDVAGVIVFVGTPAELSSEEALTLAEAAAALIAAKCRAFDTAALLENVAGLGAEVVQRLSRCAPFPGLASAGGPVDALPVEAASAPRGAESLPELLHSVVAAATTAVPPEILQACPAGGFLVLAAIVSDVRRSGQPQRALFPLVCLEMALIRLEADSTAEAFLALRRVVEVEPPQEIPPSYLAMFQAALWRQ